ncbi:hypothetical protein RI054_13g65380 [Pseudoscourfieldia marina]
MLSWLSDLALQAQTKASTSSALCNAAAAAGIVGLLAAAAKFVFGDPDYDNANVSRKLRWNLVSKPRQTIRRHRPVDIFRAANGASFADALREAARIHGALEVVVACNGARGGGMDAVVEADSQVPSLLATLVREQLTTANHAFALQDLNSATNDEGWLRVVAAGDERLTNAVADAVRQAISQASLRDIAETCDGRIIREHGLETARAAVQARAAYLSLVEAARLATRRGLRELRRTELITSDNLAAMVQRDARGGARLSDVLSIAGHETVEAAVAMGMQGEMRAMLREDMARASDSGNVDGLIASNAISFAQRHGGFGEGALLAALGEMKRRKAAAEEEEKKKGQGEHLDHSEDGEARVKRNLKEQDEKAKRHKDRNEEWKRLWRAAASDWSYESTLSSTSPARSGEAQATCVVCLTRPSQMLIQPCRHLCMCGECVSRGGQALSRCPVCRGNVSRIERIYVVT